VLRKALSSWDIGPLKGREHPSKKAVGWMRSGRVSSDLLANQHVKKEESNVSE